MLLQQLALMFAVLVHFPALPKVTIGSHVVRDAQCLNLSMSVWRKPRPAVSLLDCFASSRSFGLRSVGVVQRNRRDASCALFRFDQVCHLLSLINLTAQAVRLPSDSSMDCETVVDSEYDAITANEHFAAVWVADRGPALENLVCDSRGQRNLMRSSNVSWTSEGAVMDGVTSRLWVDDLFGLHINISYTWVLHLKRTPAQNCFIDLADCNDSTHICTSYIDHFWEFSLPPASISRALYFNPVETFIPVGTGSVLSNDTEEFFAAGVSIVRLARRSRFFLGNQFLSDDLLVPIDLEDLSSGGTSPRMTDPVAKWSCIKIGWRCPGTGMLRGIIRAVAISNAALSEDVVRRLFCSL